MDYRYKNITQEELNWFNSRTNDKTGFIIIGPDEKINIGVDKY
jgi:hypothetical protein